MMSHIISRCVMFNENVGKPKPIYENTNNLHDICI